MRKKKWLRRGLYLLVFFAALYVLFWIALFNPLEGSVESLVALIPEDVGYMVHCPWGKLRETPLFRDGFLGSPLKKEMDYKFDFDTFLYAPIREAEGQINSQLPGFFGKFSILEDFAGREVLIAGSLTGKGEDLGEKVGNSPFVALTRISFKAKFIEVLNYGFVRDRVPGLTAYKGYFRYDLGEEYVREDAPEDARYIYFSRIRDVLAISNDRDLIQKVVRLGTAGSDSHLSRENLPGGSYWFYWDLRQPKQDPGVSVWFCVRQSDRDLKGEISGGRNPEAGGIAGLVRAFFPVALTNTLTLELGAEGEDTIAVRGKVRMMDRRSKFPEWIAGFHQEEGIKIRRPVREWGEFVSGSRTFAVLWFGMDVEECLLTIFKSLDEASRQAFFADPGKRREANDWTDEELSRRLGEWFEDGVGITWARLPEAADIDLDHYDGGIPEPRPAITFCMNELENLDPEDLIDFFNRNHTHLGFTKIEELESPLGRLFKLHRPLDLSLELIQPGFAMVERKFFFSTNVGEIERMLRIKADDGRSIGKLDEFQEAVDRGHPSGKFFAFLNGPRLFEYLKDLRHEAAKAALEFDPGRFRREAIIEIRDRYPDWKSKQVQAEADRRFDEEMRDVKSRKFPEALEEYLLSLRWMESIGWLGLTANVAGDQSDVSFLDLKGVFRLNGTKDR